MSRHIDSILTECAIEKDHLELRGLCRYEEPSKLELIQVDENGRNHYLTPEAASAWKDMKSAALKDEIDIYIVSAFRSIDYQAEIIKKKLDKGLSIEEILKVSAAPGYSEHHTGRAIDIATPNGAILTEEFELTDAFKWLARNAHNFNYYLSFGRDNKQGYLYEPWHWCYN
jgi:D-alanyl-D-alanine carboxypeptidase